MFNFMKNSMTLLENLVKTSSAGSISKLNQIVFVISDGRFNKNVIFVILIKLESQGLLSYNNYYLK